MIGKKQTAGRNIKMDHMSKFKQNLIRCCGLFLRLIKSIQLRWGGTLGTGGGTTSVSPRGQWPDTARKASVLTLEYQDGITACKPEGPTAGAQGNM